jgi:uncharacterized protein with PIN domain
MKYESLINNIIAALYIENKCDMKDTLIDIKELHDAIEENHFGFIGTLEEIIKEKSEDLHICRKCFGELETVYDGYEEYEFIGMPVTEKQHSIVCKDCGHVASND